MAVFIPTDHDRALGSSGGSNPSDLKHSVYLSPESSRTGYSENNMLLYKRTILSSGNSEIKSDYKKYREWKRAIKLTSKF